MEQSWKIPQFIRFPGRMLNSLTRPFEHGEALRRRAAGAEPAQRDIWPDVEGVVAEQL